MNVCKFKGKEVSGKWSVYNRDNIANKQRCPMFTHSGKCIFAGFDSQGQETWGVIEYCVDDVSWAPSWYIAKLINFWYIFYFQMAALSGESSVVSWGGIVWD